MCPQTYLLSAVLIAMCFKKSVMQFVLLFVYSTALTLYVSSCVCVFLLSLANIVHIAHSTP